MDNMEKRTQLSDPFKVNLTAGVVLRGDATLIHDLVEMLKQAAERDHIAVIFIKVSSNKLWIQEDRRGGDGP